MMVSPSMERKKMRRFGGDENRITKRANKRLVFSKETEEVSSVKGMSENMDLGCLEMGGDFSLELDLVKSFRPAAHQTRTSYKNDSSSSGASSLGSSDEESLEPTSLSFSDDETLPPSLAFVDGETLASPLLRHSKGPVSRLSLLRRKSAVRRSSMFSPMPTSPIISSLAPSSDQESANINPFTPSAMLETRKHTFSESRLSPPSTKRVRVSDINTSGRYQREFLELAEIASGQFGTVKLARHRLDGMVYVVKVSQTNLVKPGSGHQEKKTMNEVFAHAALMKHQHVVRYYNSWVEGGQVFIQNEFCEGGSLASQIKELREAGGRFSESQLKRLLMDVLKGLQYIHSKHLVHLDIKPDNIFISREEVETPTPIRTPDLRLSSDSGAGSEYSPDQETSRVRYKIGDLGHVSQVQGGEVTPEEGDCRYMAPEFLQMEIDRANLTKADIFSLGMTIYEAASLRQLPKNSFEGAEYSELKDGKFPFLPEYSERLNSLLTWMVRPEPQLRPSVERLMTSLNPASQKRSSSSYSKRQLSLELRRTKRKLARLEQLLSGQKSSS